MRWTTKTTWLDSGRRKRFFPFAKDPKQALGPTQPPVNSLTGAFSLVVKQLGREANQSFHLVPRFGMRAVSELPLTPAWHARRQFYLQCNFLTFLVFILTTLLIWRWYRWLRILPYANSPLFHTDRLSNYDYCNLFCNTFWTKRTSEGSHKQ
jgi:hypothetical protein